MGKHNEVVIEGEGIGTNKTGIEMQRPGTLEPTTNPNGQYYLNVGAQSPVSAFSARDGFPFGGVSNSDLVNMKMPFTVPNIIAQFDQLETPIGPNKKVTNVTDSDIYDKALAVTPMLSVCEACGKEGDGKIDDADDCFYCFPCWKKWTVPDDNDDNDDGVDINEELYKRATSITAGDNQ